MRSIRSTSLGPRRCVADAFRAFENIIPKSTSIPCGVAKKEKTDMNKFKTYFTKAELFLWLGSMAVIVTAFCFFDRESYLTLCASLVGVTSLIFSAKGNPFGQFLMIIFSLLYGVISYGFQYYGEMITYLGMTAPMAAFSLVSWLE